jgi:hypothetical protein
LPEKAFPSLERRGIFYKKAPGPYPSASIRKPLFQFPLRGVALFPIFFNLTKPFKIYYLPAEDHPPLGE